ncbi:MAG: dihydropteroate synthase [Frankiales bacterium]|nr:dihydropteroate synthase [Frankiales bacterium]
MPVVVGLPDPGRCLVMGVVNTTPDSFSDGGLLDDAAAGVAHGLQLVADGADLVDVGGESTRPGAERVDEAEEARRVLPVVEGLAEQGVVVSVDTMRASIARAAVSAGARLVNDVSGGLADPDMVPAMADLGVGYVVMHWRGHSTDMQSRAVYGDVVAEVRSELEERVAAVLAGGVSPERLIVDPGLGFAKQPQHSWALLRSLEQIVSIGYPVLVGASRKGFLGALLSDEAGARPLDDREDATTAVSAMAADRGAWAVRVHRARASADAVRVAAACGALR